MDYEKLYNEALKRAKGICNVPDQDDITIARMEYLFPELKESDDEKIRKELIQLISCMHDKDPRKKDWLSWLEKQGEQKPTWSDEDERLRYSCIKHIEEELQEISKDKFGHSEIISDLKEDCRERINWLKSLKERPS